MNPLQHLTSKVNALDDIDIIGNVDVGGNMVVHSSIAINTDVDTSYVLNVNGDLNFNDKIICTDMDDASSNVIEIKSYETKFYAKNPKETGNTDNYGEAMSIKHSDTEAYVYTKLLLADSIGSDSSDNILEGGDNARIKHLYVDNLDVLTYTNTDFVDTSNVEVNALSIQNVLETEYQGIKGLALDVDGNTYLYGHLAVGKDIAYTDDVDEFDINEYELDVTGIAHLDCTTLVTQDSGADTTFADNKYKDTNGDYNTNQRTASGMIHMYSLQSTTDAASNGTQLPNSFVGNLVIESTQSDTTSDVVGNLASSIEFRTNNHTDSLNNDRWPLAYIVASTNTFDSKSSNNNSGGLNFFVTPNSGDKTEWSDSNLGASLDSNGTGTFTEGISSIPELAMTIGHDQRIYMTGNLGIGKDSPSKTLDVGGSTNIDDDLEVGGDYN